MTQEIAARAVASNEQLARFVLSSRWIRADQTIKPDAFMPHPEYLDVSVTRHTNLTEGQIWGAGENIAARQTRVLLGRADLAAATARLHALEVSQAPTPDNRNHAIIAGWPADKPAQKIIALELAAASVYRSYANSTT